MVCECQRATGQSGKNPNKKVVKNTGNGNANGNNRLDTSVEGSVQSKKRLNNAAASGAQNGGIGSDRNANGRKASGGNNLGAASGSSGTKSKRPKCTVQNNAALAKQYAAHVNSALAHNYTYSDCLPVRYRALGLGSNFDKLKWHPACLNAELHDANRHHRHHHHHDSDFSVQCASLCKWKSAVDVNKKRYPETLHVANCTERNRKCPIIDDGDNSQTSCQEIYINVPVLVRTNKCLPTGEWKYDARFQRIAVGCTCARQRSDGSGLRCGGAR
jgi:hypothetical protein